MRLFNSLGVGNGRGCLNRHLAQSDLGMGVQQINVVDVVVIETAETGEVSFTALTDCERGKNDNGEVNGNGVGQASGRPESPGKSGEAPGRNK